MVKLLFLHSNSLQDLVKLSKIGAPSGHIIFSFSKLKQYVIYLSQNENWKLPWHPSKLFIIIAYSFSLHFMHSFVSLLYTYPLSQDKHFPEVFKYGLHS